MENITNEVLERTKELLINSAKEYEQKANAAIEPAEKIYWLVKSVYADTILNSIMAFELEESERERRANREKRSTNLCSL